MLSLRKVGCFFAVVLMAMFFCVSCGGGSGGMSGNEPALTSGPVTSGTAPVRIDVNDQNTGTGERTSARFSLRLPAPAIRLAGGSLAKATADMTYAEIIDALKSRFVKAKLVFDGADSSHIVVNLSVTDTDDIEIDGLSVGKTIIRAYFYSTDESIYYGTIIFSGLLEKDLIAGENNLFIPMYVAGSTADPNANTMRYYNLIVNNFPQGVEGKEYRAYVEIVDTQGDSWGDAYGVSAWYGNNQLTVGGQPLHLLPPTVRIQMSISDYEGKSIAQAWSVDALEILDTVDDTGGYYTLQYDAGANVNVNFIFSSQSLSKRYIDSSSIDNINGGMGLNFGVSYAWEGSLNQHYTHPLPYDVKAGQWLAFTSISTWEDAICQVEHYTGSNSYSVDGVPKVYYYDEYICTVNWQKDIINYTSTDNYRIWVLEVPPVSVEVDQDTPEFFTASGVQAVGKFTIEAAEDLNLEQSSIFDANGKNCWMSTENSYKIKAGENKEISVICDIPADVTGAKIYVSYLYFTYNNGGGAFTVYDPMEFSLTKK